MSLPLETFLLPGGQTVVFELRRSLRSRRLRLAVYPGGRLVVSAPYLASRRRIEAALFEKAAWISEKVALMKKTAPSALRGGKRADFLRHKAAALELVTERLIHYNQTYGFRYGKITIRDQKTRWGSCSRRGDLSFNYRLVRMPRRLADYVIVHELCHRGRFDHSPAFWRLVARTIPDYADCRAELKRAGRGLG